MCTVSIHYIRKNILELLLEYACILYVTFPLLSNSQHMHQKEAKLQTDQKNCYMYFKSSTSHLRMQKKSSRIRILIQKRFAETTFSKGIVRCRSPNAILITVFMIRDATVTLLA